MYKVFYYNRTIFLIDNIKDYISKENGLFFKYSSKEELLKIIHLFEDRVEVNKLFIYAENLEVLLGDFISCYRLIEAAGGIIRNSEGKILLIKRFNKWDLPKGKAEKGETAEQTALREIWEEVGLKNIKLSGLLHQTFHTYKLNGVTVLKRTSWFNMFYEDFVKPVPLTKEDITEAKWFSKEELSQPLENTYASLIDVFEKAGLIKL